MSAKDQIRTRRSLQELQDEYKDNEKKPLEDLMRAWKGIKELPPSNPRSFFMLGGYHGEPFRGAGWGNASYWGGYCNHGNILFPTWHRAYLIKLEEALQSIGGCEEVMMPYWDETSEDSLKNGIPWALTDETFQLDGETIPNPLRSFVLTKAIVDHVSSDPQGANYSKPKGYETVRYPRSGLVQGADKEATEEHNKNFPDYRQNVDLLNRNVVDWLTSEIVVHGRTVPTNVRHKYLACLEAPDYTVFSNHTSSSAWNDDLVEDSQVVALESPHNSIHLAIGGFDLPGHKDHSPIDGANGDMGENDTAALDPIFYFHHCFVDYVFWQWQKRHQATDHLEVIPEYPGTNSVDGQNPTAGIVPNTWLTLESPLSPFKKRENGSERAYTSLDCINIERQLGYRYSPGSLDTVTVVAPRVYSGRSLRVAGVNRAGIRGSFLVSVTVMIDGKEYHVGTEAVLSRWNVQNCANCQTHLEVKAFVPLPDFGERALNEGDYRVQIRTRDGAISQTSSRAALPMFEKKPFYFSIR